MQRREALKLFLAGGVLPVVPADLFGFFRDSHPASGYALRTLDPHQNELVVVINILWPAQRNAEVDRLELGRVAAPAAVGFLERERLFNPQFSRNRKALPGYP